MSTTHATPTVRAVSRLLEEINYRLDTADQALQNDDQARAHDDLASAEALISAAVLLTAPPDTADTIPTLRRPLASE